MPGPRVSRFSATRTDLLACRAQIALARAGRDLLEDKRNELMKELRRTAERLVDEDDALERAAAGARAALGSAEAFDGPEAVHSAALAAAGDVWVGMRPVNVMGVPLAIIEAPPLRRPAAGRGYALSGTSPRTDHVAERFEEELDAVVRVASAELRLHRLADQIRVTTRRVNALEHVVVPGLEREHRAIRMTLEERERQERFRLKRVKAGRRRPGGPR